MRFETDGIDAGVGAHAASHVLQPLEHIVSQRIERLASSLGRHAQPLGHRVNRDDAPTTDNQRAADRKLTDRTTSGKHFRGYPDTLKILKPAFFWSN
jgi:hypothetical protein